MLRSETQTAALTMRSRGLLIDEVLHHFKENPAGLELETVEPVPGSQQCHSCSMTCSELPGTKFVLINVTDTPQPVPVGFV